MKIRQLKISKLRGIVDIELKLNGKNTVIWGPNGVGKSAIVDAVDFLFTGDITRLTGKSTGDVSVKDHGPHVGYNPKEAIVTAEIESDDGTTFTVSRSIANKNEVTIPEAYRVQFEELSKNALNGAHFLSRRELLQYILTTPKNRSDQIQTLLNIADLKDARDAFVKLENIAKKFAKEAKEKYDKNVDQLKKELIIGNSDELLESVNKYRSLLGGLPLKSLEEKDFTIGLTYTDSHNEYLANTLNMLETINKDLPDYISAIEQNINSLCKIVNKIDAEKGTITEKNSIALIKNGIELLFGTGVCPLCLTQWASEEELREFLLERQSKGEIISSLIDDFSDIATKLINEVDGLKKSITSLLAQTKKLNDIDLNTTLFETALKDLAVFSDMKNTSIDLFSAKLDEIKRYANNFVLRNYPQVLNECIVQLTPLIDTQSKTRADAWQKLNNSKNYYIEICKYKQQHKKYQSTLQKASELLKTYESSQEEHLNNLFNSISDRFAELYKTMHCDDEGDFSVALKNIKSGISLNVDFHGLGQFPPMAYHSEGHQDSMGIALFFALMESLTTPNFEVIVLDDVVMSVDIEHRKNFCRILNEFFGNKQFVITTHDQIWARYLVDSGVVPNENYIHFSSWSVETGPMISIGHDVWKLALDKSEIDLNGASAFLRREMECFFEKICDKLSAKLQYNSAHRWDFGQYMNAAYSTLIEKYSTAKKHAQKYSNTELVEKITAIENGITASKGTLDRNNWVTNALVHYNPQYIISKNEFKSAVDAMRIFTQHFQCDNCNIPLYLTFDGLKPSTLRCKCGKNIYPL